MRGRFAVQPARLHTNDGHEILVWVVVDREEQFLHSVHRRYVSALHQAIAVANVAAHARSH